MWVVHPAERRRTQKKGVRKERGEGHYMICGWRERPKNRSPGGGRKGEAHVGGKGNKIRGGSPLIFGGGRSVTTKEGGRSCN